MVCYYLRVSRNCNIVFLVKLKDTPGVVDGDRMLEESGIYNLSNSRQHLANANVIFSDT